MNERWFFFGAKAEIPVFHENFVSRKKQQLDRGWFFYFLKASTRQQRFASPTA